MSSLHRKESFLCRLVLSLLVRESCIQSRSKSTLLCRDERRSIFLHVSKPSSACAHTAFLRGHVKWGLPMLVGCIKLAAGCEEDFDGGRRVLLSCHVRRPEAVAGRSFLEIGMVRQDLPGLPQW